MIKFNVIIGMINVVIEWIVVVIELIFKILFFGRFNGLKLNYVGVFIVLNEIGIEFIINVRIVIWIGLNFKLIKIGVVMVVGVLKLFVFLIIKVNV